MWQSFLFDYKTCTTLCDSLSTKIANLWSRQSCQNSKKTGGEHSRIDSCVNQPQCLFLKTVKTFNREWNEKMKKRFLLLVPLLLLIFSCNFAFAENAPPEELECNISIESYYVGDADLDKSSASFSTVGINVEGTFKDFSIVYESEIYNWDDKNKIQFVDKMGKKPWTALQKLGFGYDGRYGINDSSVLAYSVQVSSQFENAITGDSVTVTGFGGYNYSFSPSWNATLGVAAGYNPLGWTVLPVAGVQFLCDKWDISIGFPTTYVGYSITDELAVRADVGFEGGVYRLAKDSHVSEEGYVKKNEAKASLLVDWVPCENLKLTAGPQFIFARTMKFYNKNHNRVYRSEDPDSTWGVAASLTFSF